MSAPNLQEDEESDDEEEVKKYTVTREDIGIAVSTFVKSVNEDTIRARIKNMVEEDGYDPEIRMKTPTDTWWYLDFNNQRIYAGEHSEKLDWFIRGFATHCSVANRPDFLDGSDKTFAQAFEDSDWIGLYTLCNDEQRAEVIDWYNQTLLD